MTVPLPARKRFYNKLSEIKYDSLATIIILDAEKSYNNLLTSSLSDHKYQNRMIVKRVLPMLSIFQSLISQSFTQEEAILIIETLMKETFFTTQLSGIRLLNHLFPDPFPLIKPFLRLMMRFSDTPKGQEIKRDDSECFAINVYQCFIHDTLKELDASELTPVFCATDDLLSAAMPKIEWKRTQTLGRGGEMCDFCWCRK